jgi:spermidine synthase
VQGEREAATAGSFEQRVAPGVRVTFDADRFIEQVNNSDRETLVLDHVRFGRMMLIDGRVHSTSADEFILHEMMSHVPLLAHGRVERVLILGGADGALAEEVLKHRGVRSVLQVHADPVTSKLARLYFRGVNAAAFSDARFQLRIAEAAGFLESTDERFDLILLDLPVDAETGASAPGERLFRNARGCLAAGGIVIARLGIPFLQPFTFFAQVQNLSAVFSTVSAYLVPIPSVFGGPVAIGWGSNVVSPDAAGHETLSARFADAGIDTDYYTPDVHRASFALPRYVKEAVNAATHPRAEDAIGLMSKLRTIGRYREVHREWQ